MSYGCAMCGKTVRRRRWIALNRYCLSNGRVKNVFEARDGKDEYLWEPETSSCTGALLHYPECLLTWLEGKMIEVDWRAERSD